MRQSPEQIIKDEQEAARLNYILKHISYAASSGVVHLQTKNDLKQRIKEIQKLVDDALDELE